MKDNFPKFFYVTLALFILLIVGFVSMMTFFACGFTPNCAQGRRPVERTPLAVPLAASLPEVQFSNVVVEAAPTVALEPCRVAAADLMGTWVSAGYPEKDAFNFTDADGKKCQATFTEDVQKLFNEADLWYDGALACSSCHSADLAVASAKLNLTSYSGMLAGSQRVIDEEKGTVVGDIFGGGNWEQSLLYAALFLGTDTPLGHPTKPPASAPVIFAGQPVP